MCRLGCVAQEAGRGGGGEEEPLTLRAFFHRIAAMIRYYIPADGDDPAHPNIFHVPATGSVTLRDVRQHFPLPGSYHFRFKKQLGESKVVWLDLVDDSAEVPSFDGVILAKVSRISMDVPKPTAAGNNGPPRSTAASSKAVPDMTSPSPASVGSEDSTTADLLNMGTSPSRISPANLRTAPPPQPQSRGPVAAAPDTDPFGLFADAGPVNPTPLHAHKGSAPGGPAPSQVPPQPPGAPDLLNFDSFSAGRPAMGGGPGRGPPPRGPPMARPPFQNPNSGWSQF